MSYVEFFKVWCRSIHTIDAYIYTISSTCYPHLHFYCIDFVFEVSDLSIALALTMLPLQTSDTSGLTLFGTHKLELIV